VDLFEQLAVEAFQLATQALSALMDYSQVQVKLQHQVQEERMLSLQTLKRFQTSFTTDRELLYKSLHNIADSRSNLLLILIDQWLSDPSTATQISDHIAKISLSVEEIIHKQLKNEKLNSGLISIADELYSKFIASHLQDISDSLLPTLCTHLICLADEMRNELQTPVHKLSQLHQELVKLIDKSRMKSNPHERIVPHHRQILNNVGVGLTFMAVKLVIAIPQEVYNYYFSDPKTYVQKLTSEFLAQLNRNKLRILKATTEFLKAEIADLVCVALVHLTTQVATISSLLEAKLETNEQIFGKFVCKL
jgi:hypothetical protein